MVKYVAGLARLKLSVEEVSYFQTHLAKIIDYVSVLEKAGIDTEDPFLDKTNSTVLRSDKAIMREEKRPISIKVPRIVG